MTVADLFKVPQTTSTDLRRLDLDVLVASTPVSVVMKSKRAVAVLIRFDDMVDILAGIQARALAEKDVEMIKKTQLTTAAESPFVHVRAQP